MKTFTKLASAALLTLGAATASANPFSIDLQSFGVPNFGGDADVRTGLIENFITQNLVPTSTYIDDNGTPGINTGDSVRDTVTNLRVASLSPLLGLETEGYGFTWDLRVSWDLEGTAVVAPDPESGDINYLGQLTSGTIRFDLTNLTSNTTFNNILTLNLTGSGGTIPSNSAQRVNLFAEVASVRQGVFFDEAGNDFRTLVDQGETIRFVSNTDLAELNNPPVTPVVGGVNGFDAFTRVTNSGSVDIRKVPEPSTLAIMGLALLGFAGARRRKS